MKRLILLFLLVSTFAEGARFDNFTSAKLSDLREYVEENRFADNYFASPIEQLLEHSVVRIEEQRDSYTGNLHRTGRIVIPLNEKLAGDIRELCSFSLANVFPRTVRAMWALETIMKNYGGTKIHLIEIINKRGEHLVLGEHEALLPGGKLVLTRNSYSYKHTDKILKNFLNYPFSFDEIVGWEWIKKWGVVQKKNVQKRQGRRNQRRERKKHTVEQRKETGDLTVKGVRIINHQIFLGGPIAVVQGTVINTNSDSVEVNIKVQFYDADGNEAMENETYNHTLAPGEKWKFTVGGMQPEWTTNYKIKNVFVKPPSKSKAYSPF